MRGLRAGPAAVVDTVAMPSTCPSGGWRISSSAPSAPPAPPLLSTITVCPSASPSRWPTTRAMMSVVPPAAKGTINRTGLLG